MKYAAYAVILLGRLKRVFHIKSKRKITGGSEGH